MHTLVRQAQPDYPVHKLAQHFHFVLQVRYLKIHVIEKSSNQALLWVQYISQTGVFGKVKIISLVIQTSIIQILELITCVFLSELTELVIFMNFMLVLMLEVQKECNGDVDASIWDDYSLITCIMMINLQTNWVWITENAL